MTDSNHQPEPRELYIVTAELQNGEDKEHRIWSHSEDEAVEEVRTIHYPSYNFKCLRVRAAKPGE